MKIDLQNVGKRFNRQWIFRGINYSFTSGTAYAITGHNGSGKSTLLQVIAGATQLSEGVVQFEKTDTENAFTQIGFAAPYLELIEEMTMREFLQFHFSFKPILNALSIDELAATIFLQDALNKQIRNFSSGMKQRLKLAQAIFADVPVVLLDEPCTNLDEAGIVLYKKMIAQYCPDRLLIVCSNDKKEYDFCTQFLNIEDFKHFIT
jgi:ABC-type multidrug transport system ATPase subunit